MKFRFCTSFNDWRWQFQIGEIYSQRYSVLWGFGQVWCELWIDTKQNPMNWGFRVRYDNPRRPTYESNSDSWQTVFGVQRDGYKESCEGDYMVKDNHVFKPYHVQFRSK